MVGSRQVPLGEALDLELELESESGVGGPRPRPFLSFVTGIAEVKTYLIATIFYLWSRLPCSCHDKCEG